MDSLVIAAVASVMVAVLLGFLAVYQTALFSGSRVARDRLKSLLGPSTLEYSPSGSALREENLSTLPGMRALLSGKEWSDRTREDLERADLRLRVGEFLAIRVVLAIVLAVITLFLVGAQPAATLLAIIVAVVGYKIPAMWVQRRKKKRIAKLETQLEEALTMISNSLKAGFGLLQALEMAGEQLERPISTEFQRTVHDINVGSPTEDALLALSERSGSYDLDIVVTAIIIQRSVGGNLAEILDTVAHTMRERVRLRGEINTLTSQQKLTGYVLGVMPFAVIVLLFLVSRDYMTPMFTTLPGQVMLAGAVVLEAVGVMLIKRIIAIEV